MTGGAISVFTIVMNLGAKTDVLVIMHSHTALHCNSIQVTLSFIWVLFFHSLVYTADGLRQELRCKNSREILTIQGFRHLFI